MPFTLLGGKTLLSFAVVWFHHFACWYFFFVSLKTKSAFKSLVAFFLLITDVVFTIFFTQFFNIFPLVSSNSIKR